MLRKYEGLIPGSQPIEGMEFNDEKVYLRKDVRELHTKSKWREY